MRDYLAESLERALAILRERRQDLDAGAKMLLEKETITPEDFPQLLREQPAQAAQ